MQPESQALMDFNVSFKIVEALLLKEKLYVDPPLKKNIEIVHGLRGGAIVLMVASFENYLKEVTEERLGEINSLCPEIDSSNLPEDLLLNNYFKTFESCIKGPYNQTPRPSTQDKIEMCKRASQFIVTGRINPRAFVELARSNPNQKKVKTLFKSLGIEDIFERIKIPFDDNWGQRTASRFIPDTLDYIVDRRHDAAHSFVLQNLSRNDLGNWARFIKTLTGVIDEELYQYVTNCIAACTKKNEDC